ncbi:hypothetical protein ACFL09_04270 [Planctomycetota bacterium]
MVRWQRWMVGVVALLLIVAGTGCGPYWRDRADDAKETVDFGITTSSRPRFAFYLPGDYFNFTPLGYSNVKGTFHGIGNRQVGSMPIVDQSWGLLLWGSKKICTGEFNPDEPRHVSPEAIAELKAAGKPLPTEPARYHDGPVRMLLQDNAPPHASFYT